MTEAHIIQNPSIKLLEHIGRREHAEISRLQALCRAHDGVELKLELDFKLGLAANRAGVGEINEFLYHDGEELIGYLGVCGFGGGTLELNGMTHPGYRRQGVFGRLFSLAMDECRRRKPETVLLLCDRKSAEGLRFIGKTGAALDHTELEMLLKAGAPIEAPGCELKLRRAIPSDEPLIARLDADDFDIQLNLEDIPSLEQIEQDGSRAYMAEADGRTVGKVRLEAPEGVGGIYGLCVLPEYRGKGYGRGILLRAVEKLRGGGAGNIRLQVDADNSVARHIYEKAGFQPVYMMDYFKLQI